MSIKCKCKECGHEDTADRTTDKMYATTDCPKCGKRSFSKKMFFPKNMNLTVMTPKKRKLQ